MIALEIELGIGELRLVLRLFGDRLIEGRLKGPRIDLSQHIAGLAPLAFGEGDLVELAVDAAVTVTVLKACTVPIPVR